MPSKHNISDQALNLIDKSQHILLLTHARADADGLGAMISMYLVLKELSKNVTAVTADPTPDNLDFLPAMSTVQNSLASAMDFIVTVDCSKTPLSKIKYNLENNRVNIILTPKSGMYGDQDISFAQGKPDEYDLIITFDTGNLEHLGAVYDQNPNLFFETPLINIDHHASNTDFGQVNLVDIVAASATEVLYDLLKAMEKKYDKRFINEDIATLLLAGIITDTGNFQHANTSPRAMETAAELMDLGARQQEIIKNIYKTKKLSTLKLWGIVLSKVQVDPVHRMVWSTISATDLREAGATAEETGSIIDDLLTNAPGAEVIFLIKENEDDVISVSMRSTSNQVNVGKLCSEMGGGGHTRAAGFKVKDGSAFEQVVSDVIDKVRRFQQKRLNIDPEDIKTPSSEKTKKALPDSGEQAKTNFKNNAVGKPVSDKVSKKETYLEFDLKKSTPKAVNKNNKKTLKSDEKAPNKKRRRPKKKTSLPSPATGPSEPVTPPAIPTAVTPEPVTPPATTATPEVPDWLTP